jgi:RHS repeat-associated protein
MEGRSFSISSYRFGFGGQEKDDEIAGPGNSYYAQYWQYDPRIGRRWNLDPKANNYAWQSAYSAFNNNPILYNDPLGLEGEKGNNKVQKHRIKSGETLTSIAKKHNTSVESLAKWNSIKNENLIYEGDELIVSDPARPAERAKFESYPEAKESTGWTSGSPGVQQADVTNGVELAQASLGNKDVANIKGDLLEAVKSDPTMVAYEKEIVSAVRSDSRYGKEAFFSRKEAMTREFGGKRGSGSDWFSFGKNDPFIKKETWQVAGNQLTWALRHATVSAWAEVGKDGAIRVEYRLYDTLDLTPQAGREPAYNTISWVLGLGYHTILGGNKNMQTRAQWSVTK